MIRDVKKGVFNACPIEGCEGGGWDKFGMYRHFCLMHPEADIISDGELTKCNFCGMRVKDEVKHAKSETCKKGRRQQKNEKKQK